MTAGPIIEVERLVKRFRMRRRRSGEFTAVDDVSFTVGVGETLGLVGETGAGKSTIARCILGLERPSSGRIGLFGQNMAGARGRAWKQVRRSLQAVFQDPKGAMNPRWSVAELVGEPLRRLTDLPADRIVERVEASLASVGLGPEFLARFRHQLSGGQQQRVNIARAIVIEPECIVLDEPVAALDSAIKRDVVALLGRLREDRHLAYLLISHDLRIVRLLCDRIIVLFRGRIVEMGPTATIMAAPRHPYTRQLLAAQMALPGEAIADPPPSTGPGDDWSLDQRDLLPVVGDLVQLEDGHYVAQPSA
jgi:ABC-type glutathione transport system ATPase component